MPATHHRFMIPLEYRLRDLRGQTERSEHRYLLPKVGDAARFSGAYHPATPPGHCPGEAHLQMAGNGVFDLASPEDEQRQRDSAADGHGARVLVGRPDSAYLRPPLRIPLGIRENGVDAVGRGLERPDAVEVEVGHGVRASRCAR